MTRFKETDICDRKLSLMYPSLALSDDQRPCAFNNLSEIPLLAAVETPPLLKLWRPNLDLSKPISSKSLVLSYKTMDDYFYSIYTFFVTWKNTENEKWKTQD
jgi:hypothetical protein